MQSTPPANDFASFKAHQCFITVAVAVSKDVQATQCSRLLWLAAAPAAGAVPAHMEAPSAEACASKGAARVLQHMCSLTAADVALHGPAMV